MSDLIAEANDLIARALASGARAAFTCSFQAEDVAALHLLRRHVPRIPVLFLDTGYHFAEVLAFRDQLAREWDLELVNLRADVSNSGEPYRDDPARCCHVRKVEPLMRALNEYDVWFTGLRREQSPTRANLRTEETHTLPSGRTILKVSPLAGWTWRDVQAYSVVNDLPVLELYERGYTSIGCEPCTSLPTVDGGARSGRWGGQKLECGIHTVTIGGAP